MGSSPPPARRSDGSLFFPNAGIGSSKVALDGKGQLEDRGGSDISAGRSSSDHLEMEDMHSDDDDLTDDEETGLTHAERKRRKRRKARHQQLDERVVASIGEADDFKKAEDRMITSSLVKNTLINAVLIGLWYSFSISISVYNKWMFSPGNLDFHFPLFTTSIHMVIQFLLASSVLYLFPRFRPSNGVLPESDGHGTYTRVGDGADTDQQPSSEPRAKKPLMTSSFYFTRITPCGTATALDIGLGNFSLRFITLTFFTMCKSSVLAFVLIFAFIFRLEKPTWKLCAIIALMTIGVIMMVAGEAAFNALGFILVMTASFCSGFRWSLTQILLLRNPATSNPFSSIFFLTPSMFLILFSLALPIEGIPNVIAGLQTLSAERGTLLSVIIVLFPGALAFMMVAAEFALLKRTSVVTLSVCGIFKEVLTISAASLTFGDPLSPINVSGLCVTIASIAAYNWLKYHKLKAGAVKEAHDIMNDSARVSGGGKLRKEDSGLAFDEDAFEIGRDSTSTTGLMRDSLTLGNDIDRGGGSGTVLSHAPMKRPEDME